MKRQEINTVSVVLYAIKNHIHLHNSLTLALIFATSKRFIFEKVKNEGSDKAT
jgi:hypothetical protein